MDPKPSILVVEDDDALRRMLAVSLSGLAHVVTAASVEQAMQHLGSEPPPAVVITDVMMPGASGIELARTIRKTPRLSAVAIVMLSARTGPRDLVEGINAGARHYVTKPFRSQDLHEKIARLLKNAPPAAPPLELEVVEEDPLELDLELELVAE